MFKKKSPLVFTNTIRLGNADEEIESNIPDEFQSLVVPDNGDGCYYSKQIARIASESENKLIELIIIPDRYFTDPEVLQTVQTRDAAHLSKNGIGVVMTATAAKSITPEMFPDELWCKIYKLSTIRHGFETEQQDENAELLINLARICVEKKAASFHEIVIRACGGAGFLHQGLADPSILQPIGLLSGPELDETTAQQARSFLHGTTGEHGSPEYKTLKQLSIRTQTLNIKHVALSDPDCMNVVYNMRATLDKIPLLRHLSVKAYYDTVNPVPEHNPTRMGRWEVKRRPASLLFPKAVRLISPDYEESGEEKKNHLTRSAMT